MSAMAVGYPSRVNQASLQNRKHSQADALPQPKNKSLKYALYATAYFKSDYVPTSWLTVGPLLIRMHKHVSHNSNQ